MPDASSIPTHRGVYSRNVKARGCSGLQTIKSARDVSPVQLKHLVLLTWNTESVEIIALWNISRQSRGKEEIVEMSKKVRLVEFICRGS